MISLIHTAYMTVRIPPFEVNEMIGAVKVRVNGPSGERNVASSCHKRLAKTVQLFHPRKGAWKSPTTGCPVGS